MGMLQWAHAAYLVLLTLLVTGCVWTAWRMDADR